MRRTPGSAPSRSDDGLYGLISAAAEADLRAIHDYIVAHAGVETALRFVDRIEDYCRGFATAPERGRRRDDLRPGLRTVGFRRRATILFEVDPVGRRVVIHGVYYAGRSFEGEAGNDDTTNGPD